MVSKMRQSSLILIGVLLIGLGIVASIYWWQKVHALNALTLNFIASVEGNKLEFNQVAYQNPGGRGKFKIRDFQFFLSNIQLISDSVIYSVPNSYHLARFDNDKNGYSLLLDKIPKNDYRKIQFSIGVDKIANGSILSKGDLNPNGRMAWSWDVGYKFMLFEGGLVQGNTQYPLVYHVGFDENYKTKTFNLTLPLFQQQQGAISFDVDVMKIFKGLNVIDMAEISSVKFDREDAKLLADNFQEMVTLVEAIDKIKPTEKTSE